MKGRTQQTIRVSIFPLIQGRKSSECSRPPVALLTIHDRAVSTYPEIPKCPPSLCQCVDTPKGLNIDRKLSLRGTVPIYSQHVIIPTGQKLWGSRIEEDDDASPELNMAKELKALLGPSGKYHDPYNNVLISNCTLTPTSKPGYHDLMLFPQCTNVTFNGQSIEAFVKGGLASLQNSELDAKSASPFETTPRNYPTVFICGHDSRDRRCGILGPLIESEFLRCKRLRNTAATLLQDDNHVEPRDKSQEEHQAQNYDFSVSLISHIGGHKWAGNVIIYCPPSHQLPCGKISPLAGTGVWYGRVEPQHVEGIIEETIRQGRLTGELLRGVHE